ncbi:hypothetical protein V1512DRAFT_272940 [Lipomyces arxii]|uniref:uncharacterized protein n=1 Tax=Lipomyces arxii TaxID=56418 RepID=UPI0034CE88AC
MTLKLWIDGFKRSQVEEDMKVILDNISFDVPSGSVMAIVGGSGSGKTSSLYVMAARMKISSLQINVLVLLNGHTNIHKVSHAYVLQQDVYCQNLPLEKLCNILQIYERGRFVEEVILELGLKECADTVVGGEKRRLSIRVQLLSNTSVLFLNEPTTRLYAFSAQLLVQTLRKLARKKLTLITLIHQSCSDFFFLFDSKMLLQRGSRSISYFERRGHMAPTDMNPADTMIDLATYDLFVQEWRRVEKFRPVTLLPGPLALLNAHAPLLRERIILSKRTTLTTVRDEMSLLAMFLEVILNGTQGNLILMYKAYWICTTDAKVFDRDRNEGMFNAWILIYRPLARLVTEDLAVRFLFAESVTNSLGHFLLYDWFRTRRSNIFFLGVLSQHYASITLAIASAPLYGFSACASTIFSGYFGDCPYGDEGDSACEQYTGAFQLPVLLVAILCVPIVQYLFAAFMFHIKPWDVPVHPILRSLLPAVEMNFHPIAVYVDNVQINTILGPSGSGKNSLLNLSTVFHRRSCCYRWATGSTNVMKSICSYFAADLRLPKFPILTQKRGEVEDVIAKMGFIVIGTEFLKSISGVERRRVSFSVHLLNDPKVLLLDEPEPVFGLDSFTAASILTVLKSLAEEGRIQKVVELVYSETVNETIKSYFQSCGLPFPPLTNVADHILLVGVAAQMAKSFMAMDMNVSVQSPVGLGALQRNMAGFAQVTKILQQFSAKYFVGMLCNVALYSVARDIFYCEQVDGVYVFVALVTGVLRTVPMFFAAAFVCFATANCGESIGIAFNTACNTFLFNYGFEGLQLTCKSGQGVNGCCPLSTGDEIIAVYSLRVDKALYSGLLLLNLVYYRVLASVLVKEMRLHLQILKDKDWVSDYFSK